MPTAVEHGQGSSLSLPDRLQLTSLDWIAVEYFSLFSN